MFFFIISISFAQKYPQMVFVKGDSFKMGSNDGYDDEKPIHTVHLSNFFISKHEITVLQYKDYCRATGTTFPGKPTKSWYTEHDMSDDWSWKNSHPIVNISWYEANAYCEWLSKSTGDNYSLPTEAQWEYAARGGSKTNKYKYSGSNNIDEVAWYDESTDESGTKPVGQLKPNELGLYDMSGNAMEWCLDGYGEYSKKKQKNPQGANNHTFKVIRGGSWYYVSEFCKVSQRDGPKPAKKKFSYGFRIVKNID